MKKKLIFILIIFFIGSVTVFALNKKFNFNSSTFKMVKGNKKKSVFDTFNKDYALSYSIEDDNSALKEEIIQLTKKTTFLLFGEFNNKNESSENYYKRKKEFYNLRYNPTIPKDPNNPTGFDTSSQEYMDDVISGFTIPQLFIRITDLSPIYNSYGDIRVGITDKLVASRITIPNVLVKVHNEDNPMEYDYKSINYVMHYFYKKLNNEWKLYYFYGESSDEIDYYFDEVERMEQELMSITPSYQSKLSSIYSFDKIDNMPEEKIKNIHDTNINNIVYLTSVYNNNVVATANGFFISNGLIITTWNFVEKSLVNAQYMTVKDSENPIEIEGIVTANPEMDIAIIKVKDSSNRGVTIGNSQLLKVEDPAIILSSKFGTGLVTQKGIIVSNDNYIESSIPLASSDEGSPLFNENGEVIGLNTAKEVNASTSLAIKGEAIKEAQEKFINVKLEDIKSISFDELKEKYYYTKYNEESIKKSIPKSEWNKLKNIGKIEESIKLELVKANYKDNIASLRYKNSISNFVSSMQMASLFKQNLMNDGYNEILNTDNKAIYKNDKYKVIIMDEFDYLIIVMVKL